MSDTRMLIVAAYQDVDVAEKEFRALAAKVESKALHSDGMILVGKDAEGNPRLADTGNHMGRRGAGSVTLRGTSSPPRSSRRSRRRSRTAPPSSSASSRSRSGSLSSSRCPARR